jgi:hypothetical protein
LPSENRLGVVSDAKQYCSFTIIWRDLSRPVFNRKISGGGALAALIGSNAHHQAVRKLNQRIIEFV